QCPGIPSGPRATYTPMHPSHGRGEADDLARRPPPGSERPSTCPTTGLSGSSAPRLTPLESEWGTAPRRGCCPMCHRRSAPRLCLEPHTPLRSFLYLRVACLPTFHVGSEHGPNPGRKVLAFAFRFCLGLSHWSSCRAISVQTS